MPLPAVSRHKPEPAGLALCLSMFEHRNGGQTGDKALPRPQEVLMTDRELAVRLYWMWHCQWQKRRSGFGDS